MKIATRTAGKVINCKYATAKYQFLGRRLLLVFVLWMFLQVVAFAQCNNFTAVSAGNLHSMGIKADGTLWAWGTNGSGQLGDGTTTTRNTAVPIAPGTTWIAVSAGERHTIAIKSDGTLWGWGHNDRGQVDNVVGNVLTPKRIGLASNWWNAEISAGSDYTLIVNGGSLYAWGSNASAFGYGRLGLGNTNSPTVPTLVSTGWRTASANTKHSLGIKSDGTLWAWGDNFYGELGIGTTGGAAVLAPQQVGTATNWRSVSAGPSFSGAITTGGTLWTWGYNQQGQLGDGTIVNKNVPTQIGSSTSWSKIIAAGGSGGQFVIAKQTNSTLWSWGGGAYPLGLGRTDGNQLTPIQIGTATDWGNIAAGGLHVLATKNSNGALWAWGIGAFGQLGNGSALNYPSPIQIGAGGGYSNISNISVQSGMTINPGANSLVYNCGLVASLTPNGINPALGYAFMRVWLQFAQPAHYVKRHYEITPNTNAATATGRVTLYFTQQEFNDFNYIASNTLKLPTYSSDPRKANIRIEKRGGTSSDNTGLPDTYPGAVETIDPVDTDIVWNSTINVWEVSFDVTGFSGFFVKTQDAALPVTFGNISASIKDGQLLVNWQTLSETNNSHFSIEASADGVSFTPIGRVASLSTEGNSTSTQSYQFKKPINTMAVASLAVLSLLLFSFRKRKYMSIFTCFLIAATMLVACNKGRSDVAVNEADDVYIRIVQVDKDGHQQISKTVKALKR